MNHSENSGPLWPKYLVSYAFLIAVGALGVLLMQGLIVVLLNTGEFLGASRYVMTAINQFGFVLLGLFWLIGFFAVEAYLRHGVRNGQLWTRMAKVLAWEVGLLVLVFALQSLPL